MIGVIFIIFADVVMVFWSIQKGRSPIERPLFWYGLPLMMLVIVWSVLLAVGLYLLFKISFFYAILGLIIFYPIFPIFIAKPIKDLTKRLHI